MIISVMKRSLFIFLLFLCAFHGQAQKINGQWRGFFDSNGDIGILNGGSTEYVLELEINGNEVTGNSYSYFNGRAFYVICSLNGSYDKKTKKIVVNEVDRIKGSTPPDWSDCLQTHILYYEKQDGKEVLTGRWKTSPYQEKSNGLCGNGSTTLSRRVLTNTNFAFNKESRTPINKPKTGIVKAPDFRDQNKVNNNPVINPVPKPKPVTPTAPPVVKNDSQIKKEPNITNPIETPIPKNEPSKLTNSLFENRNTNVLKTIEIEKDTLTVTLYDNGEIDGDTVSLFFNGKLIMSHKKLTDQPLKIILHIDQNKQVNELIMYAENLGEIPPNTALMVVNDGDNRYEVRIASTLEQSGTIRFVHKL